MALNIKFKTTSYISLISNAIEVNYFSKVAIVLLFLSLYNPEGLISQKLPADPIIYFQSTSVDLNDCIEFIHSQTGYVFSYSTNNLNLKIKIRLPQKQLSLSELLAILYKEEQIKSVRLNQNKIVLVAQHRSKEKELSENVPVRNRVSGVIQDAKTGEALVGAYISDLESEFIAVTNEVGQFHMLVPYTTKTIYASYVGYEPSMVRLEGKNLDSRIIKLKPNSEIDEILITGISGERHLADQSQNYFFRTGDPNNTLNLTNEIDPIKSLMHLPSIQSGHEAQNSIFVRGGSHDQNLILMDGVPLYESSHVLGVASVFNMEAIKNIQIFKQAFPSRYGGKLSSVIDFQLKDGNRYEHKMAAGMNSYNMSIHAEGPIQSGKSSYSISARKSLLNLLFDDLIQEFLEFDDTAFNFHDFNAKITHHLDQNNIISFSGFIGKDKVALNNSEIIYEDSNNLKITNADLFEWGTRFASINLTSIMSNSLFGRFQAYTSEYSYNTRSSFVFDVDDFTARGDQALDIITRSRIEDIGMKSEFSLFYNNNLKFEFGGSLILHQYKPSIRQSHNILDENFTDVGSSSDPVNANEIAIYGEAQIALKNASSITLGSRLSSLDVGSKSYFSIEPRINYNMQFGPRSRISVAFSKMTQFAHLLVNSGIGLPAELYLPSTDEIPPESAEQYSISFTQSVNDDLSLQLGGYYKLMDNVLEYSNPYDLFYTFLNDQNAEIYFQDINDWKNRISTGKSEARGIEVSANNHNGNFRWDISYSLSKVDRIFEGLNQGISFPFKFDRRHDLSLQSRITMSDGVHLNLKWVYGTGHAFSLAIEQFQTNNGNIFFNTDAINNFRFKPYHRLDISVQFYKSVSWGESLKFDLGILNAYNRNNTYYVYLFENPLTEEYEIRQISILPLLPHFNIYFTF